MRPFCLNSVKQGGHRHSLSLKSGVRRPCAAASLNSGKRSWHAETSFFCPRIVYSFLQQPPWSEAHSSLMSEMHS